MSAARFFRAALVANGVMLGAANSALACSPRTFPIRTVYFEAQSAKPSATEAFDATLGAFVADAREVSATQVRLHPRQRANNPADRRVAEQRVALVRDRLVSLGIRPELIGKGDIAGFYLANEADERRLGDIRGLDLSFTFSFEGACPPVSPPTSPPLPPFEPIKIPKVRLDDH